MGDSLVRPHRQGTFVTSLLAAVAVFWSAVNGVQWWRMHHQADTPAFALLSAAQTLPGGRLIGRADARLIVHVFSDYQCPACRGLWRRSNSLLRSEPSAVAFIIHAYPLATHRFAVTAAVAAECAGRSGRFHAAHDYLFRHSVSLSLETIIGLPAAVGLPDTTAYNRCTKGESAAAAINRDREVAEKLGVNATPIVIIGRDVFRGIPSNLERRLRLQTIASESAYVVHLPSR